MEKSFMNDLCQFFEKKRKGSATSKVLVFTANTGFNNPLEKQF